MNEEESFQFRENFNVGNEIKSAGGCGFIHM